MLLGAAFIVALSVRLIIYPYGIVLDLTLPWEYSDQTCRDVGLEIQPTFGAFIGEC